MTNRHKQIQTGLLPRAGALFVFALLLAPVIAGAQEYTDSRSMQNRINQLENQIQTLSRSVYRGAPMPQGAVASGGGDSSAALGVFGDRLQAIEDQQRNMIGQIEKLQFDVRQMQDQLQKFQADTELRFQQAPVTGSSATTAPASSSSTARTTLPPDELAADPAAPSADAAVRTSGNSPSGTLGTLSSGGATTTAESLYESGFSDIRESNFDSAQKKFTDFMSRYPTHALAGNAQYWLAETYYVKGDYRQAAKLFAKGYQDYPQGQKASDCLLKLGLSLAKLGQKEDACLSLQQLQSEFPGDTSPVNRRAKQEMSQLGCG